MRLQALEGLLPLLKYMYDFSVLISNVDLKYGLLWGYIDLVRNLSSLTSCVLP